VPTTAFDGEGLVADTCVVDRLRFVPFRGRGTGGDLVKLSNAVGSVAAHTSSTSNFFMFEAAQASVDGVHLTMPMSDHILDSHMHPPIVNWA
jgi:hypothetical protein